MTDALPMEAEPGLPTLQAAQGEMFPELGVLEAARLWEPGKGEPQLSGKVLLKDWERCERVCQRLLAGESQRSIARDEAMGRNSIRKVMEVLEQRGLLEPLKKRLSRRLGHVAEALTEDILEAAENGSLPANVKPIAMAIALDKKAMLDGEATQVIEVRREGLSLEALNEAIRAAKARLIDVESDARLALSEGNGGNP